MSTDNPAVSIIVPIYNVEKYIGRCVKSILNQTFKKYELLLVNDGSTDGSINVCRELVKDDARVKILNKVNGGLSDARNFGIDNSIGEYIIFIDSDDYVDKDFVKELYTSIKNNDAEVCSYVNKWHIFF
ncbi:glycosyltransferase family 2 protein [Limosilactobacillus fermentum]|uniref:glycosyltransferase family 2 protein n=1 Tax=Limosilactobacillus fermentum TaxID=1613 RepID=UPI001CA6AC89|nr:glycosyltransferase family 2 protein [Limosilactobacillus fermentum]QZY76613.1 glycosyltransferase [Limosilactobacillus fermentum]